MVSSRRGVVVLLLLVLCTACGRQREYPDRPLMLVCPWAAGGGTDRVSRQIAALLETRLGVPVNVVNATGGGGVTGHTRGAQAQPDGYTLTMITPELTLLHWRGLTNITYQNFDPLMSVNGDAAALFVAADSPFQSPGDILAALDDPQQRVRASGSAFGSIWHIAFAGWLQAEGRQPDDVIWVSLGGSAPALQELMAGGIDVVCLSVPEAQSLLDAGKVRCLAVMGSERLPELPKVPTIRETGADWGTTGWRGLALPLGVPTERRAKLLQALDEVVSGPEYQEFLQKSNFAGLLLPPAEFTALLESSDQQFGAILQSEAFRAVHIQRFGPYLFPGLIGTGLALILGSLLVTGGWKSLTVCEPLTRNGLLRVAVLLASIVVYILIAEPVGFVATCAGLLLVNSLTLGASLRTALMLSLLLPPTVYQLFSELMRVTLPAGWLGW